MDLELTLAAVLTAPGAAAAAVFVSAATQAIKGLVMPDAWQHGRAPMLLAAVLAALLATGAVADAGLGLAPSSLLAGALAWLAVYTGAIGTHQTVTKAARMAGGTTDRTGPDVEG